MKLNGLKLKAVVAFSILLIAGPAIAQFTVTPQPGAPISELRLKAAQIYERLAGVKKPIDAQELIDMEARLAANDPLGAAAIATSDRRFYDITVRQLATRMSTREETVKAPLSDFVATMVGVVRDDVDARRLLDGDFYYAADPALAANVRNALVADIIKSNNHYDDIDTRGLSLFTVLQRRDGQQIANSANAAVPNPDPAGLITSRAFTEAHAVAGTNRRMVHFSFKQFLCVDMEQWADTSAPDAYIGMDVDRAPGGDPKVFANTCKGCHGQMDGMRSAFAHIDFADGYLKHGLILNNADQNGATTFAAGRYNGQRVQGIAAKIYNNQTTFPAGFRVTDASWRNQAINGINGVYFGWDASTLQGYGIRSYGRMLGDSDSYARCMVRRVFQQTCGRGVTQFEVPVVRDIASEFKRDYNLKTVFQRVATSPACIGN